MLTTASIPREGQLINAECSTAKGAAHLIRGPCHVHPHFFKARPPKIPAWGSAARTKWGPLEELKCLYMLNGCNAEHRYDKPESGPSMGMCAHAIPFLLAGIVRPAHVGSNRVYCEAFLDYASDLPAVLDTMASGCTIQIWVLSKGITVPSMLPATHHSVRSWQARPAPPRPLQTSALKRSDLVLVGYEPERESRSKPRIQNYFPKQKECVPCAFSDH